MTTRKVELVLMATFLLLVQLPQNLEAGIFKFGSNQNGTRGFLSFLFGRPRVCNCLCGRSNRLASRLQGGEFTQSHEFPWLAAIVINGSRVATGALINDRYILTANSPLVGLTPYDVKVTLGAYDRCFSDLISVNDSISSITPLPNYDQRTGNHDVALIKLTNPITFNRNINPICLPDPNARYLGQVVTVASWGAENVTNSGTTNATTAASTNATIPANTNGTTNGSNANNTGRRRRSVYADYEESDLSDYEEEQYMSNTVNVRWKRQTTSPSTDACVPKKLGLPVLGEGRCPDANINTQLISGDTGCAGISGAQNQACQNDAGSPVQFRDYRGIYQLVGIISMINNCTAGSTMPTLYTRINGYVNWIYSNTQDACYCSQTLKFGF